MQIKILGCSGGIGGDLRTTSMLIDDNILIDAGSGVGDLLMEDLLKIDHIFITHAHLDHIAFIPPLLDTVLGFREAPVTIHALQATIDTLRAHIFNWKIWPDFNAIPSAEAPLLIYSAITLGETINLNGRKITPIPANHVVPAVGYHLEGTEASLIFTGDTTTNDALWPLVNKMHNLKYLIIETAFRNDELELAKLSKHLCPSLLVDELNKITLTQQIEVFITHLKPGEGGVIMQEIAQSQILRPVQELKNQQHFIV